MARTRRSIKTPVGRSTVKFFVVPRKIIKTGLGVALTLTLFYLYSLVACDRRQRPVRRETHLPINVTASQGLMSQDDVAKTQAHCRRDQGSSFFPNLL